MPRRELSRTQRMLRIGLVMLLGLLALALAQDRLRARPSVEHAYATVAALNESMNQAPIKDSPDATKRRGFDSPTTQADVQEALGRKPDRIMDYGPYKAEVYSWRAGLPWRTYDYYAVYEHGEDRLLLLMHYAFELPPYEGTPVYIPKDFPLPPSGPVYRSFPGRIASPEAASGTAEGETAKETESVRSSDESTPQEPAPEEEPAPEQQEAVEGDGAPSAH